MGILTKKHKQRDWAVNTGDLSEKNMDAVAVQGHQGVVLTLNHGMKKSLYVVTCAWIGP